MKGSRYIRHRRCFRQIFTRSCSYNLRQKAIHRRKGLARALLAIYCFLSEVVTTRSGVNLTKTPAVTNIPRALQKKKKKNLKTRRPNRTRTRVTKQRNTQTRTHHTDHRALSSPAVPRPNASEHATPPARSEPELIPKPPPATLDLLLPRPLYPSRAPPPRTSRLRHRRLLHINLDHPVNHRRIRNHRPKHQERSHVCRP